MGRKLLVIDDDPEVVESIVRALSMEGFSPLGTANPMEVLDRVKRENIMIVIMDIQMPEMRGTELLKEIKGYNGMIQVIVVTGFVAVDNILTCLEYGANDCFFKPLKMAEGLLRAVRVASEKLDRWEEIIHELVKMGTGKL